MATATLDRPAVVKSTTDEAAKREATELHARLGMSLSTAINVFLRQSVAVGGMPFTPGDPFCGAPNMAAWPESEGRLMPRRLRGDLSGRFSRRASMRGRYVYSIDEDRMAVYVVQCGGHYGDR